MFFKNIFKSFHNSLHFEFLRSYLQFHGFFESYAMLQRRGIFFESYAELQDCELLLWAPKSLVLILYFKGILRVLKSWIFEECMAGNGEPQNSGLLTSIWRAMVSLKIWIFSLLVFTTPPWSRINWAYLPTV